MFCFNCGKEIEDDSTFCAHCGTRVGESKEPTDNKSGKETTHKVDAKTEGLPQKYCYFNWGAWSLGILYFFCNRLPGWGFLLLILSTISGILISAETTSALGIVFLILLIIVSIRLGFNANRLAWEKYPYNDGIEQFMKGQDKWNGWGIFFFILQLLSWVVWFILCVLLMGIVESIS